MNNIMMVKSLKTSVLSVVLVALCLHVTYVKADEDKPIDAIFFETFEGKTSWVDSKESMYNGKVDFSEGGTFS